MSEDNFEQEIREEADKKNKPKSIWRRFAFGSWIMILIIALLGVGAALVYKTSFTFSQMKTEAQGNLTDLTENMATPLPESDRLNILLLGLRGEDDPNGGLLTDSIMILSIKKSTGQVALISVPRDLYVITPSTNTKEKINYAYALGYEKKGVAGALLFSKIAVSQVTGLYLDKAISIDHAAFKEIVDVLGGIDVYLETPFSEKAQFAKEMIIDLPAGDNHLDGAQALYFVRSRFSTSDFDRARRQQKVLVAMKDKALSLGVLANPVKLFQILDSLGRNVRTDMGMSDFQSLLSMVDGLKFNDLVRKVFDTTPEGLLYSSHTESGSYILLPQGDNFSKIQETCKNMFQ